MEISRVNRSKNDAKMAYDHMSGFYDLLASWYETPLMHKGLRMLSVQKGESVLEIGCGTGKATVDLCTQVGKNGRVYGIDLSSGMLRRARRRLRECEAASSASLIEGDGCKLPCCKSSVNCVFIGFTLELFDTPEIGMVLQECHRVLKPGGRLVVVSLAKTNPQGRMVRLYEWCHTKLPAIVDCRPIYAKDDIHKAGFSIVNTEVFTTWGLPVQVVSAKKL